MLFNETNDPELLPNWNSSGGSLIDDNSSVVILKLILMFAASKRVYIFHLWYNYNIIILMIWFLDHFEKNSLHELNSLTSIPKLENNRDDLEHNANCRSDMIQETVQSDMIQETMQSEMIIIQETM